MASRTRRCTAATIAGRLRKAEQFLDAADTIEAFSDDEDEIADAFVTLCVHAGIAAADVLCCRRLGEHAQGEDHNQAVELLAKADRPRAKDLRTLLEQKTRAGYGEQPSSRSDRLRAKRAASRLVEAARAG